MLDMETRLSNLERRVDDIIQLLRSTNHYAQQADDRATMNTRNVAAIACIKPSWQK